MDADPPAQGAIFHADPHELALVLMPASSFGPENDDVLTASEVAGLDLDAGSVILPACNTGEKPGGGAYAAWPHILPHRLAIGLYIAAMAGRSSTRR